MRYAIQEKYDGATVGSYDPDGGGELQITDPTVRAHLEELRRTGGVPTGPDGPASWNPSVVVDYLRRSGYELTEEGDHGERDADPHVSPDRGRVQVRRVETAQRRGASSRVAGVRPGV